MCAQATQQWHEMAWRSMAWHGASHCRVGTAWLKFSPTRCGPVPFRCMPGPLCPAHTSCRARHSAAHAPLLPHSAATLPAAAPSARWRHCATLALHGAARTEAVNNLCCMHSENPRQPKPTPHAAAGSCALFCRVLLWRCAAQPTRRRPLQTGDWTPAWPAWPEHWTLLSTAAGWRRSSC